MKEITNKLLSLLIIGLIILDYFFGKYSNNFGNPLPDFVRIILIILSLKYIFSSNKIKYFFKNSFNKIYFIIIIYVFIACLLSPIVLENSVMNFIRIVYPFLLFMTCYILSFSGRVSKKQIYFLYKNSVLVIFVLIFAFLGYKSGIGRMDIGDNKAYMILFCTPIIFLFFPNTKALFYYSLIIIGSLIASKRGAFLGVIFTFIVFIYSLKQFNFKSKFIILFGLPILLAVMYNYFADSIFIFERFSKLENDGGSGRDIMALSIWEGWQKKDLFNQIFGSGWMSVLEYVKSALKMKKGLMAHNDWLQFLYDLGLVGVILLLSMFVALYKQIRSYKRKDKLYFSMICVTGIFFMRSISGGTFGETATMPFLFIALGFILGKLDRVKYGLQIENY